MTFLLALPRRLFFGLVFLLVFLREIILANVRVAWEILTPGLGLSPGIIRVPTHCRNEWETMLLANALTMTPGTLSMEVDTATGDLYVHALYVTDREAFIAEIHDLERSLLRAMR